MNHFTNQLAYRYLVLISHFKNNKNMKSRIKLIFLFALISCGSDNLKNFQGHWHQVIPDSFCNYSTVDINGDIVIFNKNCLNGFYCETKLIKDGSLYIIPSNKSLFSGKVVLKNDTLFIADSGEFSSNSVWVKRTLSCEDVNNDVSSNLNISIGLKPKDSPITFDSISPKTFAIINVGKIKSCSIDSKFNRDSFYMQLNTDFHNLNVIKPFLESEREAWVEDSLVNLSLILNIDKQTPDYYLEGIFEQVRGLDYVKNIYQTCLDSVNCKVGFVKIE